MSRLPEKIILHVGMAKAGSTAIQNALDAHYEDLLNQGVLFPRSILRRSNPADPSRTPGHLDLLGLLETGIPLPLIEELKSHKGKVHSLLLSIENLFHMTDSPRVETLAHALRSHQVHLVTILREQKTWFEAFYYEVVAGGISKEFAPLPTYLDSRIKTGVFNYADRLKTLTRQFEPETVSTLPYKTEGGLSLLERFLEVTEIVLPAAAKLGQQPVNVSLRARAVVEAHRWLNLFLADLPRPDSLTLSQDLKAAYRQAITDHPALADPGLLPRKATERLKQTIGTSNEDLPCSLPLEDRSTMAPARSPDESRIQATLFQHGIRLLAERRPHVQVNMTKQLPSRPAGRAYTRPETDLLLRAFAQDKVMALQGDTSALTLAAGHPNRLIIALEATTADSQHLQRAYDTMNAPSPILARAVRSQTGQPFALPSHPVDLCLWTDGLPPEDILAALNPKRLILYRSRLDKEPRFTPGWTGMLCERVGALHVYQRTSVNTRRMEAVQG